MKTIYYNASVYTGTLPLAEAFGVEEDVFFFVGTNEEAQKQTADKFNCITQAFDSFTGTMLGFYIKLLEMTCIFTNLLMHFLST